MPDSQQFTLPCDTNINILTWGEPCRNKPCCLLLHGLDNNAHIWDLLAQRLSVDFTVYAIDLRGHGDSSWSIASAYTMQKMLEDIEQVRLHLQLETFYLVGHSLGGRISTYYTAFYPNVVLGLVLADVGLSLNEAVLKKMRDDVAVSSAAFHSQESYYSYLQQLCVLADEHMLSHFAQHCLRKKGACYYNKTDPQCRQAILNPMRRSVIVNGVSYQNVYQALPAITQPTLLLRGVYSAVLTVADAQQMLRRLANGKLVTINEAGHALIIDNPSDTVAEIACFLVTVHHSDQSEIPINMAN